MVVVEDDVRSRRGYGTTAGHARNAKVVEENVPRRPNVFQKCLTL
jgi:hypothetical protein